MPSYSVRLRQYAKGHESSFHDRITVEADNVEKAILTYAQAVWGDADEPVEAGEVYEVCALDPTYLRVTEISPMLKLEQDS